MGHAQRANIHEAVQQAVEAWELQHRLMDRRQKLLSKTNIWQQDQWKRLQYPPIIAIYHPCFNIKRVEIKHSLSKWVCTWLDFIVNSHKGTNIILLEGDSSHALKEVQSSFPTIPTWFTSNGLKMDLLKSVRICVTYSLQGLTSGLFFIHRSTVVFYFAHLRLHSSWMPLYPKSLGNAKFHMAAKRCFEIAWGSAKQGPESCELSRWQEPMTQL